MNKNNNENPSLGFLDALIEIGKQFNNQLKEYSGNDLFCELFPNMQKVFSNSIEEIDESMKEDKDICKQVNKNLCDKKELNHAHIETTETDKSFSYLFRDDSPKTHDDIIEFLKERLNDFTFAACSENNKNYKLEFIFNSVHYQFQWDKNVMHFLGKTNDTDFVFVDEDFYFDETKNDFFVCDFDKKECDLNEITDECCETCGEEVPEEISDESELSDYEVVNEEKIQNNSCKCDKIQNNSCKCDSNVSYTADTLFEKINKEADAAIENDLLPIIKSGIDRIFNYKLYTVDRTGNVPGFDIIVFTLEDVKLNCEQFINDFWEIVPYTRLVRFLVETYNFPKAFILDKNTPEGFVHEVRCHLK